MPTDPAELAIAIKRAPQSSRTAAEDDFSEIQRLLHIPEAPADLCKALYEVALRLPGLDDVGQIADREGRQGLGIEMNVDGYLHQLVFDPDSRRLLGQQQTLMNPDFDYAPVGTVTGWAVYLHERRVTALPDDPPAIPGPPCKPGQPGIMREVQPGLTQSVGQF